MKRVWIPATATLLIGAGLAFAQEAPEEHPMNPIAATLIRPEVLAAEQTRLKLTEGQRESIQAISAAVVKQTRPSEAIQGDAQWRRDFPGEADSPPIATHF